MNATPFAALDEPLAAIACHETVGILLTCLVGAILWVGHACIWTASLNYFYGLPYPKPFLRLYRLFVGGVIAGFPALLFLAGTPTGLAILFAYGLLCFGFGFVVFPSITLVRLTSPRPTCVRAESTVTHDFWPVLGKSAVGDGNLPWVTRLPLTCAFRLDVTEMTLAVRGLPPEWEGLTVLLLSDMHFHGTPSRAWWDKVIDTLTALPTPDLMVLAGDYLDSDEHRAWIAPTLGRLKWHECGLAILGNHDVFHEPQQTRNVLAELGYEVLSNRATVLKIRGVDAVVCGHEGPWIGKGPDLSTMPAEPFRLCVSHTPDQAYWGIRQHINLMLCGHVHGGQVRVPVIGSIFVPSVYGRRFDMGAFRIGDLTLVAGRGLGGKEPLRFRCHPQAIRLTLVAEQREGSTSRARE